MAKSKNAPALFELINRPGQAKSANKLAVPKWFKNLSGETVSAVREPAASEPRPEPPARKPAPPAAKPRVRPAASRAEASSVLTVSDGRIQLSLNPTNAAIVVGGIVLALLFCYFLGQALGSGSREAVQVAQGQAPTDSVREAIQQPADGEVLDPEVRRATLMATPPAGEMSPQPAEEAEQPALAEQPTAAEAGLPAPSVGPNRIVIESFNSGDVKAAEFVQGWLGDQGLRTELRRAGDRIWLLTADGYDLDQPGQKEVVARLIEDLKSLGSGCRRELAAAKLPVYTLSQPYVRRIDR